MGKSQPELIDDVLQEDMDDEAAPPSERFLRAFTRSMPGRYHDLFEAADVAEHAAIAHRRAGEAAYVEVWREHGKGIYVVCVVTDDRPGLLSLISATLVVHDLDVVAAHAYTRPIRGAPAEVIDLFWVRKRDVDPLAQPEPNCRSISAVLSALVRGTATIEEIAERAAVERRARASGGTRVRFEGDEREGLAVLAVEAWDRPGLLLAMTRTLFEQDVQILRSDIKTEEGRASNRFEIAELDGRPLGRARRLQVQAEVLAALEAPERKRDENG